MDRSVDRGAHAGVPCKGGSQAAEGWWIKETTPPQVSNRDSGVNGEESRKSGVPRLGVFLDYIHLPSTGQLLQQSAGSSIDRWVDQISATPASADESTVDVVSLIGPVRNAPTPRLVNPLCRVDCTASGDGRRLSTVP